MSYVKHILILSVITLITSYTWGAAPKCSIFLEPFPNFNLKVEQPRELQRGSGRIRRWMGRNWMGRKLMSLPHKSLSELAEDMYLNRERFDLVFKGDKGLFTDLGVFDLLETSPHVLTINATFTFKANSTKTFHIVSLPSGNFVIYLKNKAPYGEELSFVASQVKTGALINWFNIHSSFDLKIRTHQLKTLVQPFQLDLSPSALANYTNEGVLSALRRLSEIHRLMGDKDLGLSIELATFQNKLQYINRDFEVTERMVVEAYKKTKELLGFWAEESEQKVITFFGLLAGISPQKAKELFNDSGGFWSENSDRFAVFMGVALDVKMAQLKGQIPPGEVNSNILLETLERHKAVYKQASDIASSWHDYSLYTYLSAAITGKMDVLHIKQFERDVQYIRKHAKGDHDGQLLILLATSKGTPVEILVSEFNQLYRLTKDGDVALTLLMGVQLENYSMNDVINLYKRASFKGEEVDSESLAKLLLSGLKDDLRPGQVISILKEMSAYTGGNLKPYELIEMVNSIISLNRFNRLNLNSDVRNETGLLMADQVIEEIHRAAQEAMRNAVITNTIIITTVITINSSH